MSRRSPTDPQLSDKTRLPPLAPVRDGFEVVLPATFSNAPLASDPTRGEPHGGLMATLAIQAAREGVRDLSNLQT